MHWGLIELLAPVRERTGASLSSWPLRMSALGPAWRGVTKARYQKAMAGMSTHGYRYVGGQVSGRAVCVACMLFVSVWSHKCLGLSDSAVHRMLLAALHNSSEQVHEVRYSAW